MDKMIRWMTVSLLRFALAVLFLIGGYSLTVTILYSGLQDGEIVKAVVGAFLTGILVPITTNIFQFYFRTSSKTEKETTES